MEIKGSLQRDGATSSTSPAIFLPDHLGNEILKLLARWNKSLALFLNQSVIHSFTLTPKLWMRGTRSKVQRDSEILGRLPKRKEGHLR